jgi:hypothetical protein
MSDDRCKSQDNESQSNRPASESDARNEASLAGAQLEKLRLEIDSLRVKNYWETRVGRRPGGALAQPELSRPLLS